MAIPKNITVEKVNQAIDYINENKVPSKHQKNVKHYLITSYGNEYPQKYVIAVARAIENGSVVKEKISTNGFKAGEVKSRLRKLGFTVEEKGKNAISQELNDYEYEIDLTKEEIKQLTDNTSKKFTITFDEDSPKSTTNKRKPSFVARKIDFDRINAAKRKIGALGEEIVFDYLTQQAEENGLQTPIHVSKEEGDGLGYDIRAFDEQGNEIKIEVKASKRTSSGGFEMTRNEVKASIKYPKHYKVYYVYAIDIKKRQCIIKIYDGPFTDEFYEMDPTGYTVIPK